MQKYKRGEEPMCGDVVRGHSWQSTEEIIGHVIAHWEGDISIFYLEPHQIFPVRIYGKAEDFELITRGGKGYGI